MKQKYINIALGAALVLAMSSCSDNDYTELDKGFNELALSTNATDIELLENVHGQEALKLSWTTGNNYGTGNAISYTLEIDEQGNEFTNPYTAIENSRQVYSWAPSVEDLNNILRDHFKVTAGDFISLEARVTAAVEGSDQLQESYATFTAIPYEPVTTTLYLLGDATPNGWSADNATAMTRKDNGVFSWTGNLTEGNFKFITTAGSFLPSYNNNGSGQLVYRTSDDQPDLQFHIDESHCYKVDVNLLDLTVSINKTEGIEPPFSSLFFVGNETDWNFRKMTQDPLDPFLFRIGVFFEKGGEFKFGTSEGSWENMYKAAHENAPYTDPEMELVKGFDPDNKWVLTASETNFAYKICVDIRPNSERMLMRLFTPYSQMYLVGDATPNGWDLGNATPMTQDASDPNIFTWTGNLKQGEFKFSADKKDDWNGAWFMSTSENEAPTGEIQKVLFIDKSDKGCQEQYKDLSTGGIDLKWKVTEAGKYTITLNQLLEEVVIVKQ